MNEEKNTKENNSHTPVPHKDGDEKQRSHLKHLGYTKAMHTIKDDAARAKKDEGAEIKDTRRGLLKKDVRIPLNDGKFQFGLQQNEDSSIRMIKYFTAFLLIVGLIGVGIWGWGFYSKNSVGDVSDNREEEEEEYNLLYAEQTIPLPINVENDNLISQIQKVLAGNYSASIFVEIRPVNRTGTEEDFVDEAVDLITFMKAVDIAPPSGFPRQVAEEFFFGFLVEKPSEPILVFPVLFFENAVSEMFKWEGTLFENLRGIFNITETPLRDSSRQNTLTNSMFEDVLIQNTDARAVINEGGEYILIYSFVDRKTLLIAGGEKSFIRAANRIRSQSVIR